MSDTLLRARPGIYPGAASRQIYEKSPCRSYLFLPNLYPPRSITSLPYDILLTIAELLEPDEVLNLGRTCKALREFTNSRAIWLTYAANMLNLCQPLPLNGFQRIKDLDTAELIRLMRKGRRLHYSWTKSTPKLVPAYGYVAAPPHEDVVWLSIITSKYTLCCTKTGVVMCWELDTGQCVASWSSGADWEIWKCRVEFDERVVYFAMAKRGANGFGTDCQLMALHFPGEDPGMEDRPPYFTKLTSFCFPGHVISVYLLDPLRRFLSAYIWIPSTNNLGLYVLLDWAVPNYVFLDTGISCDPINREWSCIGYDPENVVIHAEEEVRAYQFFYPYSFLRAHATQTPPSVRTSNPPIVPPPRTIEADFIPTENPFENKYVTQSSHFVRQWWPIVPRTASVRRRSCTILLRTMTVPHPEPGDPPPGPDDPPPGTHLFTISQHCFTIPLQREQLRWWFIREPFEIVCYPHSLNQEIGLPFMPEQVLVPFPTDMQQAVADWAAQVTEEADNEGLTQPLEGQAQNDLPQFGPEPAPPGIQHAAVQTEDEEGSQPVLPVPAPVVAPAPGAETIPPEAFDDVPVVPLVAVDFGCAVWLEYLSYGTEDLRIRYVTFPPVDLDRTSDDFDGMSKECDVRTLEIPPEIDLKQVCHIGLDQAQGTIILGMRRSNVFVLRYE